MELAMVESRKVGADDGGGDAEFVSRRRRKPSSPKTVRE